MYIVPKPVIKRSAEMENLSLAKVCYSICKSSIDDIYKQCRPRSEGSYYAKSVESVDLDQRLHFFVQYCKQCRSRSKCNTYTEQSLSYIANRVDLDQKAIPVLYCKQCRPRSNSTPLAHTYTHILPSYIANSVDLD